MSTNFVFFDRAAGDARALFTVTEHGELLFFKNHRTARRWARRHGLIEVFVSGVSA